MALTIFGGTGAPRYDSERGPDPDMAKRPDLNAQNKSGVLLVYQPRDGFLRCYFQAKTPTPERLLVEYRTNGDPIDSFYRELNRAMDELGWSLVEGDGRSAEMIHRRLGDPGRREPGEYGLDVIEYLLDEKGRKLDFAAPGKAEALELFGFFRERYGTKYSLAISQSGRIDELEGDIDVVIQPSNKHSRVKGVDGTHRLISETYEDAQLSRLDEAVGNASGAALAATLNRSGIDRFGVRALASDRYATVKRDLATTMGLPAVAVMTLVSFVVVVGPEVLLSRTGGLGAAQPVTFGVPTVGRWPVTTVPVGVIFGLAAVGYGLAGGAIWKGVGRFVGGVGTGPSRGGRTTGGSARDVSSALTTLARSRYVTDDEVLSHVRGLDRHGLRLVAERRYTLTRVGAGLAGALVGGLVGTGLGVGLGLFYELLAANWMLIVFRGVDLSLALLVGGLLGGGVLLVRSVLGGRSSTATSSAGRRGGNPMGRSGSSVWGYLIWALLILLLAVVAGLVALVISTSL